MGPPYEARGRRSAHPGPPPPAADAAEARRERVPVPEISRISRFPSLGVAGRTYREE
ncbi:hypothetical protein GCM10010398_44390 [Streptomyces fimbriatus]